MVLLVVVVVTLAAAVILWAVRRNQGIVFDEDRYPGLAALYRSSVRARYAGLAASAVVFIVVASVGRLGRGLFLAPAAAGAVMLIAVMIGQQLAYVGARTAGIAAVERRLVRDYLPRSLSIAVAVFLVVLAGVAVWTTVAAGPDSSSLARALTVTGTETLGTKMGSEATAVMSTRTPFPGSYYTLMLVIGLPVAVVLGGVALWLTARRPRNGADPELVPADDALRRQTAEGIMAAVGLAVSVSLLCVAVGAAMAVGGMAEFGVRYVLGAAALGVAALGSLGLAACCAILLLVPGDAVVKRS